MPAELSRRDCLVLGLVSLAAAAPARATPEAMAAGIRDFAAGSVPREGRVQLDIAPLVENGNTVPVTITVDSPMTAADHVRSIALFNERNPLHEVAVFTLGPRAGKASVSTRIRLATSQKLVALARMSDNSVWQQEVTVVVTLAACVEG